jgi:hypothetical protein
MKSKQKRIFVHYLPAYGCVATGLIYVSVGVIAILSFLKIKSGGADESSLLAFLNDFVAGKVAIWVILLGTMSYIIWRIYESITDPYGYGKEGKGIAKRIAIALSSLADALIAYTAIEILLGSSKIGANGEPKQQQQLVKEILEQTWGQWLIIGTGVLIGLTALIQFYYGVTRGYKERLDVDHLSTTLTTIIHLLAGAGYLARGIILAITGFFFIKAGIAEDEGYIVNTDKAFDFIGDHMGHIYFIMAAIGTIFYGLFMFTLAVSYDPDKD